MWNHLATTLNSLCKTVTDSQMNLMGGDIVCSSNIPRIILNTG